MGDGDKDIFKQLDIDVRKEVIEINEKINNVEDKDKENNTKN